MHILWDKPTSKTPVKNGILRHKTSAGRCRAALVLNGHLSLSPARLVDNCVQLYEQELYYSRLTNSRLQVSTRMVDEHILFVYSDHSALIARKSGTHTYLALPFILQVPKTSEPHSPYVYGPIDWIEPLETPSWGREYAQSIMDQVEQDIRFWVDKFKNLPQVALKPDPNSTLAWFFPLDTAGADDKKIFQTLVDGLSLIKNTGVQLIARQINAKGVLTAPKIQFGSKTNPFTAAEIKNILHWLDTSPEAPETWSQIRQHWSKNNSSGRLMPITLASSQPHTHSQHSALRSIAFAQNVLKGSSI